MWGKEQLMNSFRTHNKNLTLNGNIIAGKVETGSLSLWMPDWIKRMEVKHHSIHSTQEPLKLYLPILMSTEYSYVKQPWK